MTYFNGEYYLAATTYSTDPNVGITMKHATTIAGLKAATPQRIFSIPPLPAAVTSGRPSSTG